MRERFFLCLLAFSLLLGVATLAGVVFIFVHWPPTFAVTAGALFILSAIRP